MHSPGAGDSGLSRRERPRGLRAESKVGGWAGGREARPGAAGARGRGLGGVQRPTCTRSRREAIRKRAIAGNFIFKVVFQNCKASK